ncbi:MFS transporter [Hasllibacter sp. MH4015]|uniref:MFS transporter n=1 Tax=Hasllibacter sp. MH4015 TaxID=2854029 RepID=UPI001CD2328E|nr:MFS transporter [Hasllibacter sp. MH4015]
MKTLAARRPLPPYDSASPEGKRCIWGWWAFDWASQPYFTLGLTFIFGPYFASVAAEYYLGTGLDEQAADARAQSLWSLGQTVTGVIIAICAPILGALADNAGKRMPWVIAFSLFYVFGALSLWFLLPDGAFLTGALIAFGIGLIGAEFTTIFTNSLLPELGKKDEIGRISGTGYAWGYAGGVLALFIMLLLFVEQDGGRTLIGLAPPFGLDPEAREGTRAVGPFIAIWYVIFMIPFALWVREAPRARKPGGVALAINDIITVLKSLPRRISLAAYLGSSMFYRDALVALYTFGGTYATLVLNWSITQVGIFGIIAAITSAVTTWIGGIVDGRVGPKPIIICMILTLMAVCLFILGMTREAIWGIALPEGSGIPDIAFFICGAIIGGAGGVLQASSRTMMVRHASPDKPTEAFGLYALSGKATSFLGPALILLATSLSGDARLGMLPLVFLFAIGLVLLFWVNPEGVTDPKEVSQ